MSKNSISNSVISWYLEHRRILPWRTIPGKKTNIYHVFLSEFMLQQTIVKTVIPYFDKFIIKYPTIHSLASAKLENIMTDWSGLGYYRRAQYLHESAKLICDNFGGEIPSDENKLLKFPGIGSYTAAAIMAIGFNKSISVIDGNISRILCRINKILTPLEHSKTKILKLSNAIIPKNNNSMFVQGLMDIGATICKPRKPNCNLCPISKFCKVSFDEISISIPKKIKKKLKKVKNANIFCILNKNNEILFFKNKKNGIYSNMYVLPSTGWNDFNFKKIETFVSDKITKKVIRDEFSHVFTHFNLNYKIVVQKSESIKLEKNFTFIRFCDVDRKEIPTLFKKIVKIIFKELKISV